MSLASQLNIRRWRAGLHLPTFCNFAAIICFFERSRQTYSSAKHLCDDIDDLCLSRWHSFKRVSIAFFSSSSHFGYRCVRHVHSILLHHNTWMICDLRLTDARWEFTRKNKCVLPSFSAFLFIFFCLHKERKGYIERENKINANGYYQTRQRYLWFNSRTKKLKAFAFAAERAQHGCNVVSNLFSYPLNDDDGRPSSGQRADENRNNSVQRRVELSLATSVCNT